MVTALYLFCFLIYAVIGLQVLQIDSRQKTNRLFFTLSVLLSLWAALFVPMSLASSAEHATFFRRLATLTWGNTYSLLLHFFIILTGHALWLRHAWRVMLLHLPAMITIYLYFWAEPVTSGDIVRTPLGWVFLNPPDQTLFWNVFFNIYYVTYVLAGMGLLVAWWYKTPFKREKHQARIMISGLLLALILGSVTDVILPHMGVPLLPPMGIVAIMIPISGIWYALHKYQLMNLYPEHAVLDILRMMNEGLIIVDHTKKIHQINQGALNLLGYEADHLIGKPCEMLFPSLDGLEALPGHGSLEVAARHRDGRSMPVLLTAASMVDACGDPVGLIAIFQDLSAIKSAQDELVTAHAELELKVMNRTQELVVLNHELAEEIQQRRIMEEKIQQLALYDHLTGLPNRHLFYERLALSIELAARRHEQFAVFFLDLDSFKQVNDTLGHAMGDELLRQVASRLSSVVRKSDTVARVGGDEFLILLQDFTSFMEIETIAHKILDVFTKPFELGLTHCRLTTSIGCATYPVDGQDQETLVKRADTAMYKAKERGKNQFIRCCN